MVRLTDRPDMTLDVYRGRKTTIQSINQCTEPSEKASFSMRKTANQRAVVILSVSD